MLLFYILNTHRYELARTEWMSPVFQTTFRQLSDKLPVLKVCVGNMKFPITFGTKSNPISSRIFFVVNLYFLSCLNRKQSLVCIFMNFPFASFIKPWNYNTNSMIKHIARYYILKIIEQSFSYL